MFIITPIQTTGADNEMKQSEFLKWLVGQSGETQGGTRHIKLYYKGKQSHLPRHPSKELKTGLVEGIKKQLGLK